MDVSSLSEEIKRAQRDLDIARQDESLALPEYLDLAIETTNAASARLNILYKKAKLLAI